MTTTNTITEKSKAKKEKKAEKELNINAYTIEVLREKPASLKQIINRISAKFPERKDSLARTTKRRLGAYLEKKFDVKIIKDKDGNFSCKKN